MADSCCISNFQLQAKRNLAFHLDSLVTWHMAMASLFRRKRFASTALRLLKRNYFQKITPKQILHLSLLDSLTGKMHVQDSGLQLILAKYVCHNCIWNNRKHQLSRYHVDAISALTDSQNSIGDLLNKTYKEEKEYNGLQGHEESESNFLSSWWSYVVMTNL